MRIISNNIIQIRYGLSYSEINKNASKCPGSKKVGEVWLFQDTKNTKEFFYKIMNIINSKTIQERHCLSESAVRKNASKCPGSDKIGNRWMFPDNKKTKEFFGKIWKRGKRKKSK